MVMISHVKTLARDITENELPISHKVAFAVTSVPESVAEGIWNKAISLVSVMHAISPVWSKGQNGHVQVRFDPSFSYQ